MAGYKYSITDNLPYKISKYHTERCILNNKQWKEQYT